MKKDEDPLNRSSSLSFTINFEDKNSKKIKTPPKFLQRKEVNKTVRLNYLSIKFLFVSFNVDKVI